MVNSICWYKKRSLYSAFQDRDERWHYEWQSIKLLHGWQISFMLFL